MIRLWFFCVSIILVKTERNGGSLKEQVIEGSQAGVRLREAITWEPVNKSVILNNIEQFLNGIGAVAVFDGSSEDDRNVKEAMFDILKSFGNPFEPVKEKVKNILKQHQLYEDYKKLIKRVVSAVYFLRARINGTAIVEKFNFETTDPDLSIPTVLDRVNEKLTSSGSLEQIGIRNIGQIESVISGLLDLDVLGSVADTLYVKLTSTEAQFESRKQFWVVKFQRYLVTRRQNRGNRLP